MECFDETEFWRAEKQRENRNTIDRIENKDELEHYKVNNKDYFHIMENFDNAHFFQIIQKFVY